MDKEQPEPCLTPERREYLLSCRGNYVKDGNSALESYEKATLTLFGICLAASVGLANELLKDMPAIQCPTLLWTSWALQVVAILVLLVSFLLSHVIFEKLTALVDRQLRSPDKQITIEPPSGISIAVRVANWLSLLLFASGLICFLIFAANNLSKETSLENDPKKTTQSPEEIRKGNPGYTPAPPVPATPAPSPSPPPTQTPQPSIPSPKEGDK